jgi:hypothetical protein
LQSFLFVPQLEASLLALHGVDEKHFSLLGELVALTPSRFYFASLGKQAASLQKAFYIFFIGFVWEKTCSICEHLGGFDDGRYF